MNTKSTPAAVRRRAGRRRLSLGCYRPRVGREADFMAHIRSEIRLLRSHGHITDRRAPICRTTRGEYLVIVEWATDVAVDIAHQDLEVLAAFRRKDELAQYLGPGELDSSDVPFVSYDVLEDV